MSTGAFLPLLPQGHGGGVGIFFTPRTSTVPKRVCDAFLPLLCLRIGRIVTVVSGAGQGYVAGIRNDVATQKTLCGFGPALTWKWIESHPKFALGDPDDVFGGCGLSKEIVTCHAKVVAREHQNITCSIVSLKDSRILVKLNSPSIVLS
mmetsp:Transcript_24660/g.38209  ORF Transcript_24660/g.38209 Transcript_24660/m.38209 type:complete len:149 (+) Transcript_24660:879-1325(+)